MIILTADIHNLLPNAWVQQKAGKHEILLGKKYADIALERGIKTTFFVAGKALEEMADHCAYLRDEGLEVGGHTWSSFYPSWPHRVSKALCGSYSGLAMLQKRHITKVCALIRNNVGKEMTSWRGHGYLGDETTYKLLARKGVLAISDEAGPGKSIRCVGDLVSLPINAVPDHEYLALTSRGRFNPCAIPPVARQGIKQRIKRLLPKDRSRFFQLTPFSVSSLSGEAWFKLLRDNIESNICRSIDTTLLIHPVTMEALDNMKLFKMVIAYLASLDQPTFTVTEATLRFKNSSTSR